MALYLDMKVGESVDLDDGRVRLTLEEKQGQRSRFRVEADDSVTIGKPKARPAGQGLPQPPFNKKSGSQE